MWRKHAFKLKITLTIIWLLILVQSHVRMFDGIPSPLVYIPGFLIVIWALAQISKSTRNFRDFVTQLFPIALMFGMLVNLVLIVNSEGCFPEESSVQCANRKEERRQKSLTIWDVSEDSDVSMTPTVPPQENDGLRMAKGKHENKEYVFHVPPHCTAADLAKPEYVVRFKGVTEGRSVPVMLCSGQ